MKAMTLVVFTLAIGCASSPPLASAPKPASGPDSEPSPEVEILSPDQMAELARSTVLSAHPEASVQPLGFQHHGFLDMDIQSPLRHHRCWAGFVSEDPLTGVPDMDYICVSDTGRIDYPYTPADFNTMLANEDLGAWGDEEYFQASKLYIHLNTPIRQHAGWVFLNSGVDFLAIEFNMQSESLEALQELASRIEPAMRSTSADQQRVELYTWSNIGGMVHHWTLDFSEDGIEESQVELGRFGGGGYD
jgi:hypothetical protein